MPSTISPTPADLREAHALVVQACQKVETWKWLESQIASLLAANLEALTALAATTYWLEQYWGLADPADVARVKAAIFEANAALARLGRREGE